MSIPHQKIVVAFCVAAIAGYLGFSIYIIGWTDDAALQGDVVGTWKSFAVAAFAFWIGSSSGGKARDDAPRPVEVVNDPDKPVPVTEEKS